MTDAIEMLSRVSLYVHGLENKYWKPIKGTRTDEDVMIDEAKREAIAEVVDYVDGMIADLLEATA